MNALSPNSSANSSLPPGWYYAGLDCCYFSAYITPNDSSKCANTPAPTIVLDVPWLALQDESTPLFIIGDPNLQFYYQLERQFNPYTQPRVGHVRVGDFTFTVTQAACTQQNWCISTLPLTISVNNLTGPFIAAPPAQTNVKYLLQAQASGGVPPYQWSYNYLPPNLTLSALGSSAIMSGIPTTPTPTSGISVEGEQTENIPLGLPTTLTVTDKNGNSATAKFTIDVFGPPKASGLTSQQRTQEFIVGLSQLLVAISIIYFYDDIIGFCAITPSGLLPCTQFTNQFLGYLLQEGLAHSANGLDPPDSNYMQVFQPAIASPTLISSGQGLSQPDADALNRLLQNMAQRQALTGAITVSLDRVAGAGQDHNTYWKTVQIRTAKSYARQLSGYLANAPTLSHAAASVFQSMAPDGLVTATQLQAFQKKFVQSGFPAGLSVQNSSVLQSLISGISFDSTSGTLMSFISGENSSAGATLNGTMHEAANAYAKFGAITEAADFRGTGLSDALLYDPAIGQAYTALSNGNGGYSYIPNLFTPAFGTLRTGDLNADGKADLVLYNSQTALAYIGMGNGNGTFSFQSLFWSAGYDTVEPGDLNADGNTDFALYNGSTGTLYTAISNGDGTFTYKYALVSRNYTCVRLADFTGDGKADVFLYNKTDGTAYIGIGDGAGGFRFLPLFISPGYDLISIGDLNGDGKTDVLLYNAGNGNAASGISNGVGGFAFTPLIFSPGFTSILLADFTGEGLSDIAVYNKNIAAAYFGTGTGTGTFDFQSLFWSPGYDNVVAEDIDGDGKVDVILYNSASGTEYTGISAGDGTFRYTYQYWGIGKILAR